MSAAAYVESAGSRALSMDDVSVKSRFVDTTTTLVPTDLKTRQEAFPIRLVLSATRMSL